MKNRSLGPARWRKSDGSSWETSKTLMIFSSSVIFCCLSARYYDFKSADTKCVYSSKLWQCSYFVCGLSGRLLIHVKVNLSSFPFLPRITLVICRIHVNRNQAPKQQNCHDALRPMRKAEVWMIYEIIKWYKKPYLLGENTLSIVYYVDKLCL